jgi:hypothetical protein
MARPSRSPRGAAATGALLTASPLAGAPPCWPAATAARGFEGGIIEIGERSVGGNRARRVDADTTAP